MDTKSFDGFIKRCEKFNIVLSETMITQFEKYYKLLIQWNNIINLTTITEFDDVMLKHFVDSLSIVWNIDMNKVNTLLDVGTGAGFPGLPLKIVYPHLNVVLLDSLNKRIKFLNDVVDKLGLQDVETVHERAEDAAKNFAYRECFDLVVSRAVANLSSLSEYCIPFMKKGGYFVAYKSGIVDEELIRGKKAIQVLGGETEKVERFCLPYSDIERTLVIIKKNKNTPIKFPRKAGVPIKNPIL